MKEGLYEQIINEEVLENLNELDKEKYIIDKEKLDNEEARAILAQYIESVIRKALNYVRDKAKEDNEKLLKQIEACNKIVYILSEVSNEDDIKKYKISENGEMLTALYSKINNKRAISKEKAI
ncbi:MAG: NgoFVII family restriction endonuclease, partial [Clostridium sp.]